MNTSPSRISAVIGMTIFGCLFGQRLSFSQETEAEQAVPETTIRQRADAQPDATNPPPPALPERPVVPEPPLPGADSDGHSDDPVEPEVLTAGPVHEAFAGPITTDIEEGIVVANEPPAPVDEVPPEYRPEGDNVQWIPGYWAWDDEVNDFLWVSGLWREIPPGQRWVPGHWAAVDGGYRWVSGFWTGADVADLEYLPYPPESLEQGPNIPAPGDNYTWVPGCWNYQTTGYQWQPGYWGPAYDDWCWVPQRYVWTPRGAIYTAGFWDYRIPRRGLLFAPLRFRNFGRFGPGFRYRPYYTINPGGLLISLFVRPRYNFYYFGDFYGPRYRTLGYRPWHLAYGNRRFADPLFGFYDSFYRRQGVNFSGRLDRWHRHFDDNPDRRPARVLSADSRQIASNIGQNPDTRIRLVDSLDRLAHSNDSSGPRMRRLSDEGRESFTSVSRQMRDLSQSRTAIERIDRSGPQNGRSSRDLGSLLGQSRERPGVGNSRDSATDGRGPTGSALGNGDSPTRIARRDEAPAKLKLPDALQNRSNRSDRGPGSGSQTSSRSGLLSRNASQPPPRIDGRDGRSGNSGNGLSELRNRLQQNQQSNIDRSPGLNRDGRSPILGSNNKTRGNSLTNRGQSPSADSDRGRQGNILNRQDQQPRSQPRIGERSNGILQRQAPQPRSEPRITPPSDRNRDRSSGILQRSESKSAPRVQSQPRNVVPNSSPSHRGSSRSNSGGILNRGSQSNNRPSFRSSSPQIRNSQPGIGSRSQPRSSAPRIGNSGRGGFGSSNRGPSIGGSNRGPSIGNRSFGGGSNRGPSIGGGSNRGRSIGSGSNRGGGRGRGKK